MNQSHFNTIPDTPKLPIFNTSPGAINTGSGKLILGENSQSPKKHEFLIANSSKASPEQNDGSNDLENIAI